MEEIPKIPYEELVGKICGTDWRNLSEQERDGALGVAIVKSVRDGVRPDAREISTHLGVRSHLLRSAYQSLSMNGVFWHNRIYNDRKSLDTEEYLAWCYYAGYASGFVGTWKR